MHIAICDRTAADREELLRLIRASFAGLSVSYSVRQYADKRELFYDIQDGEGFDAVFLDIHKEMCGGVESARELRSLGYDGDIVLTCDRGEFAVEGYDVEACGYLIKPYSFEAVHRLLSRRVASLPRACLTVRRHNVVSRIPYHEILYVESCNSKCFVHRLDRTEHVVYAHLDEIEKRLDDRRFLRCHQSYLVNMDHIVKVDAHFELFSGATVCIRQRELRRMRETYLEYIAQLESGKAKL